MYRERVIRINQVINRVLVLNDDFKLRTYLKNTLHG